MLISKTQAGGSKLTPALVVYTVLGASQLVHALQCKFRLAPYTYDLCPLLSTSNFLRTPAISSADSRHINIYKDNDTPPTLTRQEYDIDLGGEGLPRDGTLPATEQCPTGTWVCFRVSNTRPNHPSEPRRTLQIVPVAGNIPSIGTDTIPDHLTTLTNVNATARLSARSTGEMPSLEVTLNGGIYISRPQRAVFTFVCNKSIEEPSLPAPDNFGLNSQAFFTEGDSEAQVYTHPFTWHTRHACPVAQDEPQQPPPEEQQPGPPRAPQDNDGNSDTEDNVSPEVPLSDNGPIPRAKIGGIVIGCLTVLALVSYGMYILRAKQRTGLYHPTLPFSMISFRNARRRARRMFSRSNYDALGAEEYEIQEEDSEDGAVVDFQRQSLLPGSKTNTGYGSVR